MTRTITQLTEALPGPEPPPALRACRQSREADVVEVEALRSPFTAAMFGDVDVRQCIEKLVCKTLVNILDEVVGFLVIADHPNVPAITHCTWTGWIRRFYRIDFASPWNTRFVHFLVWDPRYPTSFQTFLRTLYKNNPMLQQVMMVTPPGIQMFVEIESLFTMVYPHFDGVAGSILDHFQNLHINLRHRVVSKLTVRRAGEEDNIDVQPLVYHQLEVLKYVYGDIKLGTIIDLKNPNKSILVAEKNAMTVGVLTASSRVDYNYVNFFFHHVLDTSRRDSLVDRLVRMETVRSEGRRGLPFTPETISTDDQLSIELSPENKFQSIEEESYDEDEDRDELVVYWDEDGDMFRVVDPVMEYLLHAKKKGSQGITLLEREGTTQRLSLASQQTAELTYWGRPSWSNSFVPLTQEESVLTAKDRVATITSVKDTATNISSQFTPVENAYIITLFALHPDLDVRYAFDLLEASFECFTDKHICLMSLPTAYQGSPLTQHMVRMVPKMSWDFPHELYFAHRNSVFSTFTVRPITVADLVGIHELIENISQVKKITKDITKIFLKESPMSKGFVLECEGNIVGVAVISTNFELNKLQPHFKLEELIKLKHYDQEGHGLIKHLVVCSMFLKVGTFFLRQIMHQSGLETLSYCLAHDDLTHVDGSTVTALCEMTPVLPQRCIQYKLDLLDVKPQDCAVCLDHNFALFIATERLLSIPKIELNYRIVVVGASDTAMSFLESLIFSSARKYIIYNNLVLVSIHGFPLELKPHLAGDKMVPHGGTYTREYLNKISLSTHVNVLYGALTVINRKEKMICLNEDHWLRYDYLFLTTGMQFCKPWPALDTISVKHGSTGRNQSCTTDSDCCLRDDRDYPKQDCRKDEDMREIYNRASEHYAENLFVINTSADAVIALGQLKKYFKHKKEGKILIYGHGLNMYTCVESLMVFGVPGHKIVLVTAPRPNLSHYSLECNPLVEKAVVQTIEEAGVTIHRGYSLICWNLKFKYVDRVMFRNNDNIPLTLDCVALFCYGTKSTNAKTYLAVSDAGIVYNNGIIIDDQFRTNDTYVYAAGPGTRYSNRYSPAQYVHQKYYSSVEVGRVLSKTIRRLLEPKSQYGKEKKSSTELSEERNAFQDIFKPPDTLPELRDPITWVAELPGGWKYVKVSAPGRPVPLECQFNGQGDSGPILITGVPIVPDGPGYFQLSFTTFNYVREIVMFSKNEISYQNLRQLYGKHERLLNNVYEQYNQGLINDFYTYFNQPWAYVLYTAHLDDLLRECAEMFVSSESVGLPRLEDLDGEVVDSVLRVLRSGGSEQEAICAKYFSSSVPVYVEHLVLKYISERALQLPMYFTDTVLAESPSYLNSPLHRDPTKQRHRSKNSPSSMVLQSSLL